MMRPAYIEVDVERTGSNGVESRRDQLAVEEPLELRLLFGPIDKRQEQSLSITMRTPGHDAELAAGFLLSEGIIAIGRDITSIRQFEGSNGAGRAANIVRVELRPNVPLDLARLSRHFYTSSSCGVCGKSSLEALRFAAAPRPRSSAFQIAAEAIHQLPTRLRESQAVFDRTGGLHAAALFDATGEIIDIREDVGRHNAVDKLIGSQLLAEHLPLVDRGLLVSGRASFELVQKAVMGGIPFLAAVGAPSSLAVETAKQFGMTLVGFVRDGRFNVYCGGERIGLPP